MVIDLSNVPIGLQNSIDTRAVLNINGRAFKNWKALNVSRSIAQIAGSFSFTTNNKFAGQNEKWEITTGDECIVEIAGQRVITGYIDDIDDGYDINSHDISFSGRDKTADLVDCSYDIFENESEFKNQTFLQIINKLCSPFGITVILDLELLSDKSLAKPISEYRIEIGEKVAGQITTLCQQNAVLPISNGHGELELTRAGLSRAFDTLQSGVNILSNKLKQSDSNRYSTYYVVGNTQTDTFNNKLIGEGKLEDNYIKRTRPLIILVGEQLEDDGTARRRVAWEARIRAGASRKLETKVKGWTQSTGDLWPLNGLISVKDKNIGVKESQSEFLIAGINLSLNSSGGELTNMALVHPDTFALKERAPIPNESITDFDEKLSAQERFRRKVNL